MNKVELKKLISKEVGITQIAAGKAIDAFAAAVVSGLNKKNGQVKINGFGMFQKKIYKAKVGFDIQKKKKLQIPEQSRIQFKSDRSLRDELRSKAKRK